MVSHSKNILVAGIAAMLVCLMFASCSDDEVLDSCNPSSEESCDYISFGFPADRQMARAGYSDKAEISDRFMLRSADSADSLYMSAVVTDGIMSESDARGVHTCAAPVTKDNFAPNGFHVWAFWKTGSTLNPLYMNETVKNNGSNVWSSKRVHYWPGAAHTLRFFAYSPESSSISVPENENNPDNATLGYTVHDNVSAQYDIVVATTAEIPGDNNATVPLTFKHICTAVRFVVGSQMQPGRIESVTLKGVCNSGTYNMAAGSWTLSDTRVNFSQTINKVVDGNETAGTEITLTDRTFMMLPQTLPAGATIEVVFVSASGDARTLTASIAGSEWPMGKTVTYKLSVSPEYELEFSDIPTKVDAHYDIIPIKINAKDVEGNWTIASNQSWVTIKSSLTSYEKDGYWLNATGDYQAYCKSENVAVERQQTLDKSGNGEVELYLFVSENNSTADRTVKLTLSKDGRETATIDVVQKCPNWQGDLGWEVIEENLTLPYGFRWDRKVTYKKEGFNLMSGAVEEWYIKQIFKKQYTNFWAWLGSIIVPETVSYVTVSYSRGVVTVTIDYTQMGDIPVVSTADGQDNTWKLYSLVGGTSFEGEQYLTGRSYTIQSATGSLDGRPKNFAALYAVKLNAFDIHKGGSGDKITYAIIPEQTDIKWYLPASEQFSDGAGLNGQYWSSTAINDNTNAYSWNGSSLITPRMEYHNVRAVRQKP